MRICITRRVALLGLGWLTATNLAVAQSSPTGSGRPGGAAGGQQQQQGLGGPAGGSQQQQEQQQRRQRMQQGSGATGGSGAGSSAAPAGPPSGSASPAAGQTPGAPPPAASGNLPGEPSGATTPRATVGGGGAALPNVQVPQTGAARVLTVAPERLSLPEAVSIGLENNLATLLATERAAEARGNLQQVRSFLLPNISGSAYQQNRTLNLAAQGIGGGSGEEMPGGNGGPPMGGGASPIPSFVGPFNTFDARLVFSQTILNLAALREYKSSKAGVRVAELNTELAREQVATYVALTYLAAQRSRLEVAAAQADLRLAESLRELAQKQRKAGIANGIDLVRAETRAAQERLRAVQAAAAAEQAQLDFERAVGLPQGSNTLLTDTLGATAQAPPALNEALQSAFAARPEARIAEQTLQQSELQRRARAAEHYPSVDAFGDYGQSANTPFKNDRMTRAYGVRLSVPVFDGGFTRGRVTSAVSQQRQAEWQLGNARGQVEQDVREALVGWRLAVEQVRASEEQFELATRELELATQRFRAGVADNLEVVRAQAGLANARALRVQALTQYSTARLNFAAATGAAQSFRL